MVEQGRSIPNSQERGCFRAGDWLAKSPSGKPFWQIQLAIEERRSRIRESLDTPAERKAEVDALQAAKSTLAKEAPALESEIAKLTATLNKLQQAVTEAQATVDWRAEKIELAKSPTLLPSYLDGEASRVRALIKQSAALEKWWTMQAFCDGCPGLLAKNPESKTDCAAIVNHIREHCPEAIIDLANQSFDHVRIGEWFDEMRTKLAKWKPIVDAGRAKLAEDLASRNPKRKTGSFATTTPESPQNLNRVRRRKLNRQRRQNPNRVRRKNLTSSCRIAPRRWDTRRVELQPVVVVDGSSAAAGFFKITTNRNRKCTIADNLRRKFKVFSRRECVTVLDSVHSLVLLHLVRSLATE